MHTNEAVDFKFFKIFMITDVSFEIDYVLTRKNATTAIGY